jgi:CMP-N,N'-diacetyllegionaminic acid synthase
MKKILGLITARAGSRGVPGKHHKLLNGQQLITYTIRAALNSKLLDTVALSSDCHETISVTSDFPQVEIPFVRPAHLCMDETPMLPVIQHAVEFYSSLGTDFDYVCLLQPTTPFRSEQLIDDAISRMLSVGAESLITVRSTPHVYNPYWCLKVNDRGRLQPVISDQRWITRRQDLPTTFHRDGQLYILSASMINQGKLMDEDTIAFVNDNSPDINVDTPTDWYAAEKWLRNEN